MGIVGPPIAWAACIASLTRTSTVASGDQAAIANLTMSMWTVGTFQTLFSPGTRTMSSMVLREFCEADAQEINRLAVAAFEEFGSNYSDWPALAAFYGKMSDLAKSGEIVVAEIAANIVGAVAYVPPHRGKAAYFDQAWPVIRSLVVDPRSRGVGVGRALTQECIKRARRDGCPVIALHTSAIMKVALAMYLRMGFEWHHDAPAVYGVPYAVYLKKLLP